ncbi:serine O-acetyltransferase [Sphingomonas zeicaulis]|uniref:serine O-acetyltransferase EpsC n=1 Tax=Sphingomonas zeicaulis TaxID=1632740 RepID=UPI003D23B847
MTRIEPDRTRLDDMWNVAAIAGELHAVREDWRTRHRRQGDAGFPSRRKLEAIMADLSGALFPLRLGSGTVRPHNECDYVLETLDRALGRLREEVRFELAHRDGAVDVDDRAGEIVGTFARRLPEIRRLLDRDVEAAYAGDPAARSVDEVVLCYPGIAAILHHRLAHELHRLGAVLVARIIAEIAHSATAIEIHPGASIGHSFFIDHGSGVVIGETAVVGDRVRIYQAVTLGARSFPKEDDGTLVKGIARHPVVEDDVVIYAGATILGRVTIGAGSVIGGNVWLTESVCPGSIIHQAYAEQEKTVVRKGRCPDALPAGHVVAGESARAPEVAVED